MPLNWIRSPSQRGQVSSPPIFDSRHVHASGMQPVTSMVGLEGESQTRSLYQRETITGQRRLCSVCRPPPILWRFPVIVVRWRACSLEPGLV